MEQIKPTKSVSKYSRTIMEEFEHALTARVLRTTTDPEELAQIEDRYNRAKARVFRKMAE